MPHAQSGAFRLTDQHGDAPVRVLVLDDSSFDRKCLAVLLRDMPETVEITEISCLCQLGEQLDKAAFDIIVTDYYLPDGDGTEAVDMVRAHPDQHRSMVFLMSGNAATYLAKFNQDALSVAFVEKTPEGRRAIAQAVADVRPRSTLHAAKPASGRLTDLLQSFRTERD